MPSSRRIFHLAALSAVLLASATGCTEQSGPPAQNARGELTIATGGRTGVYDLYGAEYARLLRSELPQLTVHTVTTAGSIDNLRRVAEGRAQLGFATADTAYLTVAGQGGDASDAGSRLRAIARIYDEYIHVVVRADSPVQTVRDLRGLRVSTGPPSSSTELVADRLLAAVGLDADRDLQRARTGIDDATAMLRAGQLDGFFWSGGLPTPGISELSKHLPIRLLPLGDLVDGVRATYGTFYRRAIVPAATYGMAPEAVTIGVPNYLVVAASVPEALVHQLTRVLFARRTDLARKVPSGRVLDARSAISTLPIALHPGARRYYRESKP